MILLTLFIALIKSIRHIELSEYDTVIKEGDCVVFFTTQDTLSNLYEIFKDIEFYFSATQPLNLTFMNMDAESNFEFLHEEGLDKPGFFLFKDGEKHVISDFVFSAAKNLIEKIYGLDIRTITTIDQFKSE
jgi:hypothetical protein